MSDFVTVEVEFNDSNIQNLFEELLNDSQVGYELHNLLAQMCDPYVPFLTGMLADSGISGVYEDRVHYSTPYARYQYYGTEFNHTLEQHPLATALWDKVMMANEGDEFRARAEEIIRRRARELYGS